MLFIDVLWRVVNGLERRVKKEVIIEVMELLGFILSLIGIVFLMIGIIVKIVFLVVKFLKIIFYFIDFESVFKFKYNIEDEIKYELVGLVEILKGIERFIVNMDSEEYVGEMVLVFL